MKTSGRFTDKHVAVMSTESLEPPPPAYLSGSTINLDKFISVLVQPKSSRSSMSEPFYHYSERDSTASDLEAVKELTKPWKPSTKEWLVMITMAISSLVVALDATILVPVLPTLAIDLHGSATDAFWAGTSYLLSSAVVQPFVVAISDIFGRRELIVPSLLLFTVGSIVCAIAQNFATLFVGRVLQGIGGGGIMSLSQVVFADLVPLRQRPKYFTTVLASYAVGTTIGPLIGGIFVQKTTWRWCFYINLPICAIGLSMTFLFVNLKTERTSLRSKLARVDWTGGFLFISSLTSILVAVSRGGVQVTWSSWHTLVPLVVGAVGLILSILWERFYAKHPFLNKSLFQNFSAIAAYTTALLQGLVLYLALYFLSFYFSAAKLDRPIAAGIALFPATFLFTPGAIVVSAVITRTGSYRWSLHAGWALATIGAGLLNFFDVHTSRAVWMPVLCIAGIGLGMLLSGINFAIQATVDTQDAGRAAGMYAFMRSLGFAVAVALGGSVFQNRMASKLAELGLPDSIAPNAEGFVAQLRGLSETDPLRIGAQQAYVHGFRGVWIAATMVCGVGLFLSMTIRKFSLDKILQSRYNLEP